MIKNKQDIMIVKNFVDKLNMINIQTIHTQHFRARAYVI